MKSWRTIGVLLICCLASALRGEDLEEKGVYRLDKSMFDLAPLRDPAETCIAHRGSKFIVVDAGQDYYVIRFLSLYSYDRQKSTASRNEEYKLPKQVNGVDISKSVKVSVAGPISGPLIVPFKFRLGDESITGEAALGFYAGYNVEPSLPFTDIRIPVTPFVAGGISQVAVDSSGETEHETAFTWAIGVLVKNWHHVNVGLVYGEDYTGDKDWKHEGDGWFSFMIGWQL